MKKQSIQKQKNKKAIVLFSGGKDSVYALHCAVKEGYEPVLLVITNSVGQLQLSDGVEMSSNFVTTYFAQLPYPTYFLSTKSRSDYQSKTIRRVRQLLRSESAEAVFTGDLGHPLGISKALEPEIEVPVHTPAEKYFKDKGSIGYIKELLECGMELVITGIRSDVYGKVEVGEVLTTKVARRLERAGIDCTGEDGEFQTLVTQYPMMSSGVQIMGFDISSERGRDNQRYYYQRMNNIAYELSS